MWNFSGDLMKHYLIVYGSLRRGGEFHLYLSGAEFICDDILEGYYMLRAGDYPVIKKTEDNDASVFVEIYRINSYHLTKIDELEGYAGPGMNNEYERITAITSKGYSGFVYTAAEDFPSDNLSRIISGDWFNPD